MSESIQSIQNASGAMELVQCMQLLCQVQFAWSKLSTGDIESAIDTDVTEDKNALYLAILKADATFSKQLLEQVGINSTIIKPLNKDAGKNVNGTPKYDNVFTVPVLSDLRRSPANLSKRQ
jgi:hypothetical protein